jgi:hypothetical protein
MVKKIITVTMLFFLAAMTNMYGQAKKENKLFIDVHLLQPGSVTAADVAAAHAKDLSVQAKYGVQFLKYWVDEKSGTVYCLSSAPDSSHIANAHNEAHGLLPQEVYEVTDGVAAASRPGVPYYLDIHNLGAGNVTAAAVAEAHKKDLAVQKKNKVNFINYWVCEVKGIVFCLSQTTDGSKVADTHKAAHGLMPATIVQVVQGQ